METFNRVSERINVAGWLALPDFIEPDTIAALRDECAELAASGTFRAAGVGNNANHRIRPETRSDEILWLDSAQGNQARQLCLARFEQLRMELNRRLQLGLFEFE